MIYYNINLQLSNRNLNKFCDNMASIALTVIKSEGLKSRKFNVNYF